MQIFLNKCHIKFLIFKNRGKMLGAAAYPAARAEAKKYAEARAKRSLRICLKFKLNA